MKPYEMTEEQEGEYDLELPFIKDSIWKAGQKKLLEYLNEPCVEHPMTFINTGEKTYSEKRAWCGECFQSLIKDFGL